MKDYMSINAFRFYQGHEYAGTGVTVHVLQTIASRIQYTEELTALAERVSVKWIADVVKRSESAVTRAIRQLERDGELVVLSNPLGESGKQPPNDYVLTALAKKFGLDVNPDRLQEGKRLRDLDRARGWDGWTSKASADNPRTVEDPRAESPGGGMGSADATRMGSADATRMGSADARPIDTLDTEDIESSLRSDSTDLDQKGGFFSHRPQGTPDGKRVFTLPVKEVVNEGSAAGAEKIPAKTTQADPFLSVTDEEEQNGREGVDLSGKCDTKVKKWARDVVFFKWVAHLEERWGYQLDSAKWGQERSSAWNLVKRGYLASEVLAAYDHFKDAWGTEGHLTLNGIVSHMGAFKSDVKVGVQANGRHHSAAEMERKVGGEVPAELQAEMAELFGD